MFDIRRRVSLSYLGENWKDCYLEFHPLSIREVQNLPSDLNTSSPESANKAVEVTVKMLEDKFVEGFAIKDGNRVAVTKEELKDFPAEVIVEILSVLNGQLDKKKQTQ